MKNITAFNSEMWNRWSKAGVRYTVPLTHEEYVKAKEGPLSVSLTIGKTVPCSWFERAGGKKLLGLACGGGQQGPVFAAHGYDVTIMDISENQLKSERMVAEREAYEIKTVRADMTQPFPFEDESFDIVFCPVSNVFIESLENMWRECSRVLKLGGLLMVGYMNPFSYIFADEDVWDKPDAVLEPKFSLPFNPRELEEEGRITIDPAHGYEFSHTWEEQIGGQLRAGFVMLDFYESNDPRSRLSQYANLYFANLSQKPEGRSCSK